MCGGCQQSFYCGLECQKADWISGHKYGECEWYRKLQSESNPDAYWFWTEEGVIFRLTMRLHFLLKAKPELLDKKYKTIGGKDISFADVPDDVGPEFLSKHEVHVSTLLSNLVRMSPGSFSQADAPYFSSLMAKMRKCVSASPRLTGVAVYVPVSVLRHSCAPNTAYVVVGGHEMHLRAVRDIAVSDDVSYCFSEVLILMSQANRMDNMKFYKLQNCDCDRCHAGDKKDETDEPLAGSRMKQGIDPFFYFRDRDASDSLMDRVEKDLSIVRKYAGAGHPLIERLQSCAARLIARKQPDERSGCTQQFERIMSGDGATNK